MHGTVPQKASNGIGGGKARTMSAADWHAFCQQVGTAAEQLRLIALRAETAALAASDHDPMRNIARDIGLLPASNANARTFATMMLGPFAALEELRRQLRD